MKTDVEMTCGYNTSPSLIWKQGQHRTSDRISILEEGQQSTSDTEIKKWTSPRCQLIILSLAYFIAYTGYNGVQNLMSSMNLGEVSGSISVGIIYVILTITCLYAPYIVKHIAPKNAIRIHFINLGLYCASNMYPRVWTMYPAAALVGFSGGPMWVAQGWYVTVLAEKHYQQRANEHVYGLFHGIFFAAWQFTQVSGNFLSSILLHIGSDVNNLPTSARDMVQVSSNKEIIPEVTKYVLFTCYTACCVIGFIVITIFVENLKQRDTQAVEGSKRLAEKTGAHATITATFRLMTRPECYLLIPLMLANGFESGFTYSSLTANVITRNLGQDNIGYGMIIFGITTTLSSISFGKVADKMGTGICFCFAFLVQNGCIAWLWWYFPNLEQDSFEKIFALCGIWGVGDGILKTLLAAILGKWLTDEKEAAFANNKLWQCLGMSAIFFCQDFFVLEVKLVLVSVSWCVGFIGLLIAFSIKRR